MPCTNCKNLPPPTGCAGGCGCDHVLDDFGQRHCRCKVISVPPLKKKYPDPYEGTMYEDDPRLCYGMLDRPFPGCDYPYKGTMPGQYGIWETTPHSAHYPYQNPDWPCPAKFEPCCDPADCDFPPFTKPKQPECYGEIADGTVTGDYSPCCCSEYTAGSCDGPGGNDAICGDLWTAGDDSCGCVPYKETPVIPICQKADGDTVMECPDDAGYTLNFVEKKKADSRGGIHICGTLSIYYERDANYTYCGGYKFKV